jgi:3-oxoadipate enol-lactonase
MKRRNDASTAMGSPPLPEEPEEVPPGRPIELPGRGTTFVREIPGPPGAPVVILLHAFMATAGVNWLTTMGELGQRFRVVALDHRGHGRGLRPPSGFRLADCADDVAALASELGIARAIVGGYSMGGPIAQLLWRRHRHLVDGLILASTSYQFIQGSQARVLLASGMGWVAQATRFAEVAGRVPFGGARGLMPTLAPTSGSLGRWAADEIRRHHLRSIIEAIVELGSYNAEAWISEIDVPTAVVLTTRDNTVDPLWQLRLASSIPDAKVHALADGHVACAHTLFGSVFNEACDGVAERVAARVPGRRVPSEVA